MGSDRETAREIWLEPGLITYPCDAGIREHERRIDERFEAFEAAAGAALAEAIAVLPAGDLRSARQALAETPPNGRPLGPRDRMRPMGLSRPRTVAVLQFLASEEIRESHRASRSLRR